MDMIYSEKVVWACILLQECNEKRYLRLLNGDTNLRKNAEPWKA
jgi:hypothetical protein